MVWVKMWVNCPTHTVTHTTNVRKGLESTGQEVSPSCHVFFALLCSLDLLHEVAHSFRYFVLLLLGGVGVSAEGESGLMVAQFIILS